MAKIFTEQDICEAAQAYFEAWNSHDLNFLSATLSAKVALQDWNVNVSGAHKVLKANSDIFESFSGVKISVEDLYPCVSKLACACEIKVLLNDITKSELKVIDVIHFDEELKVTHVRAYKL